MGEDGRDPHDRYGRDPAEVRREGSKVAFLDRVARRDIAHEGLVLGFRVHRKSKKTSVEIRFYNRSGRQLTKFIPIERVTAVLAFRLPRTYHQALAS